MIKKVIVALVVSMVILAISGSADAARFRNSGGSWETWSQRTGKPNPTQPASTQKQLKQQR
jgi:hypothetical protein